MATADLILRYSLGAELSVEHYNPYLIRMNHKLNAATESVDEKKASGHARSQFGPAGSTATAAAGGGGSGGGGGGGGGGAAEDDTTKTRRRANAVAGKSEAAPTESDGVASAADGEVDCFLRGWLNDGAADSLQANIRNSRWFGSKLPAPTAASNAAVAAVATSKL